MKKILLLVSILYSIMGYAQPWGNSTTAGMPVWSTITRPAGINNGTYGFNTDSAKVQIYYGGTWYTMSSAGGAGNTYTGSGGVLLTASNFTLKNDSPSVATGNYYYGFSTSPSPGRYGFWPLPGGISGLTTGFVPVATSGTSLGSSNIFSSTPTVTITSGTGYASYFYNGGLYNKFDAAINIFNDSIGFASFGGSSALLNSGCAQFDGVATFINNVWVGNSTGNGLRISFGTPLIRIDNETSGGGIFFRTNAVANTNLSLYTSGNSGFNSATDDGDAVLQSYSTTLPQLEAAYNSSNRFTIQTNSSGNATLTATGGNITLAGVQNFSGYGSGTNTGTLAYALGTTSAGKVIEVPVSSGSAIASTYVPTLTNTTNITTSTLETATFTRVANIVHANIGVLLTATTSATATVLTFTLPVTTSNGSQLYVGSAAIETNAGAVPAYTSGIISIVSTTTGTLTFLNTTSVGSGPVNIIFDYSL